MAKEEKAAVLGTAVVFLVLLIFSILDCNKRKECEESGGRVEVYGHDTVWVPMSCGTDCTTYYPEDIEKWRCVHD